jgi:hypothetical protein
MTIYLIADHSTFPLVEIIYDSLLRFFPEDVSFRLWGTIEDQHDIWTWDSLFEVGKAAKNQTNHIDGDAYFVFLFEGMNIYNWFCSFDPTEPTVAFVQCSGWEWIGQSTPKFAVIYHLMTIVTAMIFFGRDKDPYDFYHERSIGCMFDLTENKEEVIYKLKSAYLCESCLNTMAHRTSNPRAALVYLNGVKRSIEWVRDQLVVPDFGTFFPEFSYMLIVEPDLTVILKINNAEICLPLGTGWEVIIFIMLLKYEKGLSYDDFSKPKYFSEYVDLYHKYFVQNDSKNHIFRQKEIEIERGAFKRNLYSSVSKIKTRIKESLCHYPNICDQIMFRIGNGKIYIPIDRKFVKNNNGDFNIEGVKS